MIKAVIFDMDGLLIDSEPLWKQAEVEVFADIGVPLTYEMTNQTLGLRIDEVVEYWHSRHPWDEPAMEDVDSRIVRRLIDLVDESGLPMEGVEQAISVVRDAGLPMAIASSSSSEIMDAVLMKLGIRDYMQVIHSAQYEAYGKPYPGVYITAAEKMDVKPAECLAIEDSANGVLAAKAAKMKCVAIPEVGLKSNARFGIADLILGSLSELTSDVLQELSK